MAILLTDPIELPNIEYQGITRMEFIVPHSLVGNEMKMDKSTITCLFRVTTWNTGVEVKTVRHEVGLEEWNASFTTDVKDVYSKLENYAVSVGYMGDGTSEDMDASPTPTPTMTVTPTATVTPTPTITPTVTPTPSAS